MPELTINSPLGPLTLVEHNGAITNLLWRKSRSYTRTHLLSTAQDQLDNYFAGKLRTFSVPLNVGGTKFQQAVCKRITEIPYGRTATYGEISKLLNSSPRAIGNACGKNPLPIIIPCHRIIGANGALTGYTGRRGINAKAFLLKLEKT